MLKRFLALTLSLCMVVAMSVTAFATTPWSVEFDPIYEGATIYYTTNGNQTVATDAGLVVTRADASPFGNELPIAAKSGYNFAGWFTGVNGAGTALTGTTTNTSITAVFAKWTTVSSDTSAKDSSSAAAASEAVASVDKVVGLIANAATNKDAAAELAKLPKATATVGGVSVTAPVVTINAAEITRIPWTMIDSIAGGELFIKFNGGTVNGKMISAAIIKPSAANRLFYTLDDMVKLFGVN